MKPGSVRGPGVFQPPLETNARPAPRAEVTAPRLGVPMMPAQALAKLGIDATTKGSEILGVLGPTQLAPVDLVQVPGKVVYFNPELARLAGFDVPASNQLTAELEEQLVRALSWNVKKPGQEGPSLEGYADRYGGFGIGHNKGAGRAAFLPTLNANIKGVGPTSLVDQRTSFDHRHGGAPMVEGFLEAIWGEVNTNLFARGSTRILAVIDNADHTVWEGGGHERRALIIRLGDQIRPAHLLDPGLPKDQLIPIFTRAARLTGTLVTRPTADGPVPDLTASMKGIVEAHARTAAEQFRYRVTHGALSPSNMELDGTQLDLGTIQSQPRTAPINTLGHITDPTWAFGAEHKARAKQLQIFFEKLVGSLNPVDRARLAPSSKSVDVSREMDVAYASALRTQMLSAAGLKEELAKRLESANPKLAAAYTDKLVELSALRNDGGVLADREVIRDVAVLDVFNLLRRGPERLYGGAESRTLTEAEAMELLRPIVRGGPHAEKATRAKAERLVRDFLPIYHQVMTLASTLTEGLYDDPASFRRSVAARAAFENEPIERLYRADLTDTLKGAIAQYEQHGDRGVFKEVVDKTIAASVRDVDGLLAQGGVRKIPGGVDIERRTIDGIDHAVRALDGGRRRLLVDVPLGDHGRLSTLPGQPQLSQQQLEALRYRFTTDGWATFQEAPAKITSDEDGRRVLRFEIPALKAEVGRLEGVFHAAAGDAFWIKDGASNFRGYTFAVPDDHELKRITDTLG